MKKRFKAALSLMIVVMIVALSSVSALAATYTYSTIYTKDSAGDVAVKVTATASNVTLGEQVTYYAKKGDEVVYLDQEEVGSTGTVDFSYITDDANGLTQSFGGTSVQTAQSVEEGAQGEFVSVGLTILDADGNIIAEPVGTQVLAQDESVESTDLIPRSIPLLDYGKILKIEYAVSGSEEMISVDLGQCVYVDEVLTVYPAVFEQDCILYITVDEEAVSPAIFTGDIFEVTTAEALEYVTLARVTGMSAVTEFGICVSNHITFANPVAVGEANDESTTILFPAAQVGADGSFAVGLVTTDIEEDHFAAGLLVKAYYKDLQGDIVFANDTKTFSDGNWFEAE